MQNYRNIFLIFAVFFFQQLSNVSNMGIDLPLIFVTLMALRTTLIKAVGWGMMVGFLQDALSVTWFGPNFISKILVGLLSSLAQKHIYRERVQTQTGLIFSMILFQQIVVWLLLKWDGTAPPIQDSFHIVFNAVLGTSAIGLLICVVVVRFRRRRMDPATA